MGRAMHRISLLSAALLALVLAVVPAASAGAQTTTSASLAVPAELDRKRVCVYAHHRVTQHQAFENLVGRTVDCALVFNDAAPTWSGWVSPWFLHHWDTNLNWRKWVAAAPDRRELVITQNLFPSELQGTDWLQRGAAGEYEEYARTLARNLVAAGLGATTIRLAHEANGTWYPYSLGTTQAEYDLWRTFWRRTVLAMRSVPGAQFRFDWTVNAGWRAISPALWYPGDDVVDIVGIDAYDSGIFSGDRWWALYTQPMGLRQIADFAAAHGKPLSIPEWGVGLKGTSMHAGGDHDKYVHGIGGVVRDRAVAYQSYFFHHEWKAQLETGPLSLWAYRRHFGPGGDAVEPGS
jgi:hypothetical protein